MGLGSPDLVAYMVALRAELHMRIVMPTIVEHSDAEPYLCMGRAEWGKNGNPHVHGFSVGGGNPRLGRTLEEVLRKLNKFYTNKENKSEMDKVGLH